MRFVLAFMLCALVGVAWASGGGGGGGEAHGLTWDVGKLIIFHLVNLLLLGGLLAWLLRGRIRDSLANRATMIKRDIDEANASRKAAQDRFDELETRLSGFERQLETMREEAEIAAEREREAILERAEGDAIRVRESAERTIRDETERARQTLREEAARLAVRLAREKLEAQVAAEDHKRLADEFLDLVEGGSNGVGNG